MRFLATARSEIPVFNRMQMKEDIFPVECSEGDEVKCNFKTTDFIYKLIHKSQVFALNFVRLSLQKKIDDCEMLEGEFIDKFKKLNLEKGECTSIDCPCIKNTQVLECDVVKEEIKGNNVVIIGKVIRKV